MTLYLLDLQPLFERLGVGVTTAAGLIFSALVVCAALILLSQAVRALLRLRATPRHPRLASGAGPQRRTPRVSQEASNWRDAA